MMKQLASAAHHTKLTEPAYQRRRLIVAGENKNRLDASTSICADLNMVLL